MSDQLASNGSATRGLAMMRATPAGRIDAISVNHPGMSRDVVGRVEEWSFDYRIPVGEIRAR